MAEKSVYDNWPGYPAHDPAGDADAYREKGVEPPWTRVWSRGRDVTDESPESWPWPWSKYWAAGWRPDNGPNSE
jgi:hypothetical protein